MPLYVKNPEVVELVEALAKQTGESKTDVLLNALKSRKSQLEQTDSRKVSGILKQVEEIQARVDRMPVLDPRTPDEILGYNEQGHFGGR
jgi:antitoxin VapB